MKKEARSAGDSNLSIGWPVKVDFRIGPGKYIKPHSLENRILSIAFTMKLIVSNAPVETRRLNNGSVCK